MASPEFFGFSQGEDSLDRPGRAERETLIRHLEDRMRSETEQRLQVWRRVRPATDWRKAPGQRWE